MDREDEGLSGLLRVDEEHDDPPHGDQLQQNVDNAVLAADGNRSMYDESYFEDDYCQSFSDFCENRYQTDATHLLEGTRDSGEHTTYLSALNFDVDQELEEMQYPELFSPAGIHPKPHSLFNRSLPSFPAMGTEGPNDESLRRRVSSRNASLPDDLSLMLQEYGCEAWQVLQDYSRCHDDIAAEAEEESLSEVDVEKLPSMQEPCAALKLVFETSLDASTIDGGAKLPAAAFLKQNKLNGEQGIPPGIDTSGQGLVAFKDKRRPDIILLNATRTEKGKRQNDGECEDDAETGHTDFKTDPEIIKPAAAPGDVSSTIVQRRPSLESGYESCGKWSSNSNPNSPPDTAECEEKQVFTYPPPPPLLKHSRNRPSELEPKSPLARWQRSQSEHTGEPAHSSQVTFRSADNPVRSPPLSARKCLRARFDFQSPNSLATVVEAPEESCSSEVSTRDKETNKVSIILEAKTTQSGPSSSRESCQPSQDVPDLGASGDTPVLSRGRSKQTRQQVQSGKRRWIPGHYDENNNVVFIPLPDISPFRQAVSEDIFTEHGEMPVSFQSPISKLPTPISTSSPLPPKPPRQMKTSACSVSESSTRLSLGHSDDLRFDEPAYTVVDKATNFKQKSSSDTSIKLTPETPRRRSRHARSSSLNKSGNSSLELVETSRLHVLSGPDSFSKRRDKNNNPFLAARLDASGCRENDDDDDDEIEVTSPSGRDYLILVRTAAAIVERIGRASERIGGGGGAMGLVEYLNTCFKEEMELLTTNTVTGELAAPFIGKKSRSDSRAPRSIWELKKVKETTLKDFKPACLTVSNCMSYLRGALLANNSRAVDECLDFAFQNVHYLAIESEDFLSCPPELAFVVLSNRSSIVLGPHGFPLSYLSSEREVLSAARKYAARHRTADSKADAKLRDLLFSAVDPSVIEQHLSRGGKRTPPAAKKRHHGPDDRADSPSPTFSKPLRQHHDFTYESCGPFVTATGTRQEYLLHPHLSSSSSRHVPPIADNKVRLKYMGQENCTSNQRNTLGKGTAGSGPAADVIKLSGAEAVAEVCNSAHTLRKVFFRYRREETGPYITGLGLQYAYRGKRKLLTVGADVDSVVNLNNLPTPRKLAKTDYMVAQGVHHPDNQQIAEMSGVTDDVIGPSASSASAGDTVTVVKLDTGEHVTGVNLQGRAVLHNMELLTNKGRRVRAHPYAPRMNAEYSRWQHIHGPPCGGKSAADGDSQSAPFCLQALRADVMALDSRRGGSYLRNVVTTWSVLSRKRRSRGLSGRASASTVSSSTEIR